MLSKIMFRRAPTRTFVRAFSSAEAYVLLSFTQSHHSHISYIRCLPIHINSLKKFTHRPKNRAEASSEGSGKLWGGRFEKDTDPNAVNWAESLTCDEEMVTEDLWGSMAHVTMLSRQGVIEPSKGGKLMGALLTLQNQNMAGELDFFEPEFANHDDVHMNMEARLIKMTGMDIGGRMHTTRSRNDQVPVSSQLRTRNRLLELRRNVVDAANAFLDRAEEPGALEQVMPGYTHFQHAQPISVAFWISHYAAALSRDLSRLSHAYNSVDANPLGGGAISGTSFPIDRHLTTRLLGFQKVRRHALDATGHRDWMCEVLNANATLSTTFSRLAEELIMWSSYEFRTVTLDDGFAMGSSMMPQKKNPGTIELLRGRHGILSGYAAAGLSMLHGLPSGYNRDFHEEKELLFASCTLYLSCLTLCESLKTHKYQVPWPSAHPELWPPSCPRLSSIWNEWRSCVIRTL